MTGILPRTLRRTDACGLWRGGWPAPCGRRRWPCARETRGGVCGPAWRVGRCASRPKLRLSQKGNPAPARERPRPRARARRPTQGAAYKRHPGRGQRPLRPSEIQGTHDVSQDDRLTARAFASPATCSGSRPLPPRKRACPQLDFRHFRGAWGQSRGPRLIGAGGTTGRVPPRSSKVLSGARRETGRRQRVRVPYDEGRASGIGPESCVSDREVRGEALTGEAMGQVWSHVTKSVRDADALRVAEGNTAGCAIASVPSVPRSLRPWPVADTSCTGTGRSHGWPLREGRSASGRPEGRSR